MAIMFGHYGSTAVSEKDPAIKMAESRHPLGGSGRQCGLS